MQHTNINEANNILCKCEGVSGQFICQKCEFKIGVGLLCANPKFDELMLTWVITRVDMLDPIPFRTRAGCKRRQINFHGVDDSFEIEYAYSKMTKGG